MIHTLPNTGYKSEVEARLRTPEILFPLRFIAKAMHDAGCKIEQRGFHEAIVEGFNPQFFLDSERRFTGEPNKIARDARAWFAKTWTFTERNAAPITECEACKSLVIHHADRCTCFGINRPHFHRSCSLCKAEWEEATPDYGSFEWCYEWIETAISEGWVTYPFIPKLEVFRAEKLGQIDAAWDFAAKSLTNSEERDDKQLGLFGNVTTRAHHHAHSKTRMEVHHRLQPPRAGVSNPEGESLYLWAF